MSIDDSASTAAAGVPGNLGARSVTAFFDTRDDADTARRDLIQAGIPADDIHVAGAQDGDEPADARPHGFWESLKELFMPDGDRFAYAEGLRRGGATVAVRTDEAAYDSVLDILDRDGAVDMDEREASWRGEGWAGTPAEGEEPFYRPVGAGTAGFGASVADHFPVADPTTPIASSAVGQSAPLVGRTASVQVDEPESAYGAEIAKLNPGSSVPPDAAYPAAAPGLAGNDATSTATPAVGGVVRDLSHGRSRVRSYLHDGPNTGVVTGPDTPVP